MFVNGPLAVFWVICDWGLFANCVLAYIIDMWTYIVMACDWMVVSMYLFGKGIAVFVFLHSLQARSFAFETADSLIRRVEQQARTDH